MNEAQREVPPPPPRRTGREQLTSSDGAVGPTLSDFWAWSSSDLLSNALRGVLAEFIVGTALKCISDDKTRVEWDAYDLECGDISIEVKSTALLQSWGTATSSPRFGIAKTRAWDVQTRTYSDECKRQADVYVFCYFTAEDRTTDNPLDVSKWEFYVASAKTLNS